MRENQDFLTSQIITYIGNKRLLISNIENEIFDIEKELGKDRLVCADLFSGSGIVARMLKCHSSLLYTNDLENYSHVLNDCYLTNKKDFDEKLYDKLQMQILKKTDENPVRGIITENYAPAVTDKIRKGERAFYTHENAVKIDSYRKYIEEIVPLEMQKFFLAPLLTEASVHVNTSGVFKGFYKDPATKTGCFGGAGKNALSRICGNIELKKPVLSNFNSDVVLFQKDAVELSSELKGLDVAYLDPPYNQHPYGANYFMLNLILENKIPEDVRVSKVSGIPSNWNRSAFNKKQAALKSMEQIISRLDAKYTVISYNSEGFISFDDMESMLKKYGEVRTVGIPYNTFRGSRNLSARDIHVTEYLFILKK